MNVADVTENYTPTTVIGQPITNNFVISGGIVKDANTASWEYEEDDVTVTYVGNDVAPIASGTVSYSIKFAVAGYDDLTVNKSAFVNVKAEPPVVTGALVSNPARITYGKIAFALRGKTCMKVQEQPNGNTVQTMVLTGPM
ncbi:MAG: hypothetical protein K6A43_12265 [Treponema sp.]|nr:hypothetical protein [Treponema sp.]